jgi:hypothetical protein
MARCAFGRGWGAFSPSQNDPAPRRVYQGRMRSFRIGQWTALAVVLASSAAHADARPERDPQQELNHEYAKLYKAVSGLRMLDELLLVKFEAKHTEQLIEQIAAFGSRSKRELEDLARAHPEVKLDEDGRNSLSKESSKRQQRDRLRSYAPGTGASGADFDRMLLLSQSAALYQLRFRVEVMAEAETSKPRREYLRGMRRDLDRLYVQAVELLDKHYFRQPARTPLGKIGGDDP